MAWANSRPILAPATAPSTATPRKVGVYEQHVADGTAQDVYAAKA